MVSEMGGNLIFTTKSYLLRLWFLAADLWLWMWRKVFSHHLLIRDFDRPREDYSITTKSVLVDHEADLLSRLVASVL